GVELNGSAMHLAFNLTIRRIAPEQEIAHASQIPRLDGFGGVVLLVHHYNLGARRHIQASFNLAAITDGDTDTGIGTDQALLANGNDDVATAGQGTHGGAATAQIRAFADDDASGDTAFD